MYTVTLPILAAKGAIPLHGEVWLPNINCIGERLERLRDTLCTWFTIHLITDPMDNPLYRATQTVATELVADGNTFTNASALNELPKGVPFIMLHCIKSGDSLGTNQTAGCGSLLDRHSNEPTRTLRTRPPQSNTTGHSASTGRKRKTAASHGANQTMEPPTPVAIVVDITPDSPNVERSHKTEQEITVAKPSSRPNRSTRNKDVDYTEQSPKKSRQLR